MVGSLTYSPSGLGGSPGFRTARASRITSIKVPCIPDTDTVVPTSNIPQADIGNCLGPYLADGHPKMNPKTTKAQSHEQSQQARTAPWLAVSEGGILPGSLCATVDDRKSA